MSILFLNYLSHCKRLYPFIAADFHKVSRLEFEQYFQWVFKELDSVIPATEVIDIQFDSDQLLVYLDNNKCVAASNLAIATGPKPHAPLEAKLKTKCSIHAASYLLDRPIIEGKRVVVIGGGQSGADVVLDLLSNTDQLPSSLCWVTRRDNFYPLDDSPFSSEFFSPQFIDYYYSLDGDSKEKLSGEASLTSKGILRQSVTEVYQLVYRLLYLEKRSLRIQILPNMALESHSINENASSLMFCNKYNDSKKEVEADFVVFCTGYDYRLPPCLDGIKSLLVESEGEPFCVGRNYALRWAGEEACNIYLQGFSERFHGIADPNLSCMAYRSAVIVNELARKSIYPNILDSCILSWG